MRFMRSKAGSVVTRRLLILVSVRLSYTSNVHYSKRIKPTLSIMP